MDDGAENQNIDEYDGLGIAIQITGLVGANVIIEDNYFENVDMAIKLDNVPGAIVRNNITVNSRITGYDVSNTSGLDLTSNHATNREYYGYPSTGFRLENISDSRVIRNSSQGHQTGFDLRNIDSTIFENNNASTYDKEEAYSQEIAFSILNTSMQIKSIIGNSRTSRQEIIYLRCLLYEIERQVKTKGFIDRTIMLLWYHPYTYILDRKPIGMSRSLYNELSELMYYMNNIFNYLLSSVPANFR